MAKYKFKPHEIERAMRTLGNGLMAIEHAAEALDYQADGALSMDQIQGIAGLIAARAIALQDDYHLLAAVITYGVLEVPDEADQPTETEKEHRPLILDDEAERMIDELGVKMDELREEQGRE